MIGIAASIAAAWLLLAPVSEQVRQAAGQAEAHVRAGRYDQAMQVLDEAQRSDDHPVFVYMRGVVEEERGNCEAAIGHYDRFLKLDVPEVDAAEARRRRGRCERLLEGARRRAAADAPVPAPKSVDPPQSKPWYADPAGGVLVVTGAVGVAVGLGLTIQAQADERAAKRSGDLDDFDARGTRAERFNVAGIVTLSVGAAILVGGVIRYAVVGRRQARARKARARLAPSGLSLRF